MTKVTKAQLFAAIRAVEACGHTVTALRLHPSGVIDVLTQTQGSALLPDDDEEGADWVALAGTPDGARLDHR